MIKIHSTFISQRWLHLSVAALGLIAIGHFWLAPGRDAVDEVTVESSSSPPTLRPGAINASLAASPDATLAPIQAHEHSEDTSTALETGMEDWQKPENVALRAELQRWHDHREETSLEQRRADAAALMAQVEARQSAGKLSQTSAALAKLMLLQGAPSDDPQHAARLQEVMTHLSGHLSFGE